MSPERKDSCQCTAICSTRRKRIVCDYRNGVAQVHSLSNEKYQYSFPGDFHRPDSIAPPFPVPVGDTRCILVENAGRCRHNWSHSRTNRTSLESSARNRVVHHKIYNKFRYNRVDAVSFYQSDHPPSRVSVEIVPSPRTVHPSRLPVRRDTPRQHFHTNRPTEYREVGQFPQGRLTGTDGWSGWRCRCVAVVVGTICSAVVVRVPTCLMVVLRRSSLVCLVVTIVSSNSVRWFHPHYFVKICCCCCSCCYGYFGWLVAMPKTLGTDVDQ